MFFRSSAEPYWTSWTNVYNWTCLHYSSKSCIILVCMNVMAVCWSVQCRVGKQHVCQICYKHLVHVIVFIDLKCSVWGLRFIKYHIFCFLSGVTIKTCPSFKRVFCLRMWSILTLVCILNILHIKLFHLLLHFSNITVSITQHRCYAWNIKLHVLLVQLYQS